MWSSEPRKELFLSIPNLFADSFRVNFSIWFDLFFKVEIFEILKPGL